ncbi:MAG: pyrroline-5-carboxylate reductase [Cyclobacteriaceae bacterium]
MSKINGKVAILGAGNLGIAIGEGIVEKDLLDQSSVILSRRNLAHLDHLKAKGFSVTNNNTEAVKQSKYVILGVQPKQLSSLTTEIKSSLTPNHVVISVITGVKLEQLKAYVGDVPIIRAMPNTAIAIGESMTCLAADGAGKEYLPDVEKMFQALGLTHVIDESLMQAATVLGASGIAFFMRYLRAATQAGVQMGFHSDEAQKIAVQTAKGAACLVLENDQHPEVEIDKVTTPQGCTIEGLNEMEHQGFSSSLIKGVMTSFHKIKNISS